MIKHGVVMVTLLILTLTLVGVVSASDITASDVDLQSFNQENAQVEIDENYEISASYESSDSLSSEYENSVEISADESSLSDVCERVEVSDDGDFISYSGDDEIYDSYDDLISCAGEDESSDSQFVDIALLNQNLLGYSLNILNEFDSFKFNKDAAYELGYDVTTSACNLLDFKSADEILVIATADSNEIDNVAMKNTINGILDASNGYITYEKGNLITLSSLKSDLIDIAFFSRKCESLTMVFYENGAITSIFSDDVSSEISAGLWDYIKNLLACGVAKGVLCDELKHFLSEQVFEQNLIQTLLGCNKLEEPVMNTNVYLLSVPMDSDEDTVIWSYNSSDDNVCINDSICESLIGLSMENNTSENGMIAVMSYDQSNSKEMLKIENKLNPDINEYGKGNDKSSAKLTSAEIKQIGVDAANKALSYFKSCGINVKKDYSKFYILTSAGYAKIKGMNTKRAIYGLLEVFGPEISKNIGLIQTPLWKDLIFYFVWVKDANNKDFVSYCLKYYPSVGKLIESSEHKKQGDFFAYLLGLFDDNQETHHGSDYYDFTHDTIDCAGKIVKHTSKANKTNVTKNKTASNATNSSNITVNRANLPGEIPRSNVNPYNILYTLASILFVCGIFGVSYSKR